jgi:hypothetical protein
MLNLIDTRRVCGLYAFGQWFDVEPNTLSIDCYKLAYPIPGQPSGSLQHLDCDIYDLQYLNEEIECCDCDAFDAPGNATKTWTESSPSRKDAIQFIDAQTGNYVSFALIEIKAFRWLPNEENI